MAKKTIYRADDIQESDYAFDVVGKEIAWGEVVDDAETHSVTLQLSLSMLFTAEGEIDQRARATVNIPKGSDEITIRQRVYLAIRNYIKNVGRKLGLPPGTTPDNAVALLSSVTMI